MKSNIDGRTKLHALTNVILHDMSDALGSKWLKDRFVISRTTNICPYCENRGCYFCRNMEYPNLFILDDALPPYDGASGTT